MSHQTIVVQELRVDSVIIPARDPLITSTIKLPVGGAPLTFVDENDGLLLTLDANGNIISEKGFFELTGQAEPAASPAGKMRLYFDSATNKLLISENGGAYVGLVDGAGDVVGPGSATDMAIALFDGVTGKLIKNSLVTIDVNGTIRIPSGESLEFAGTSETISRTAGELLLTATQTRATGSISVGNNLLMVNNANIVVGGFNRLRFEAANIQVTARGFYRNTTEVVAATGDEVLLDFVAIVNKATSGNYTGIKLNVTETLVPGVDNRLIDLQVDGVSQFRASNSGDVFSASGAFVTTAGMTFDSDNDAVAEISMLTTGAGSTKITFLQIAAGSSGDSVLDLLQGSAVVARMFYDDTGNLIRFQRGDTTLKDWLTVGALTGDITLGDGVEGSAIFTFANGGSGNFTTPQADAIRLEENTGAAHLILDNSNGSDLGYGVNSRLRVALNQLRFVLAGVEWAFFDNVGGFINYDTKNGVRWDLDSNNIDNLTIIAAASNGVDFATGGGSFVFDVGGDGDNLIISSSSITIVDDLDHDGTNIGFYGTTPAPQSAAYTRNATIVEDRTLLASASATILNNNNVLAALIVDLQSRGFIG